MYLKNNFIYFYNYKIKCSIGKRGLTDRKKEGDFKTPKGNFKFKFLLYRKDRIKKIQSKIKKAEIKKNMGWCDDPKSKNYNKLVKLPSKFGYEKLYKKNNIYDIILVLNYNMKPIIKNKGSAIFIHVATKDYRKTKGCVALKKRDLLKIIKKIKKNTKVKIETQK